MLKQIIVGLFLVIALSCSNISEPVALDFKTNVKLDDEQQLIELLNQVRQINDYYTYEVVKEFAREVEAECGEL